MKKEFYLMQENNTIVNRVASSGLITFDLEKFYQPGHRVVVDIKDQLAEGLVLREKVFREFITTHDWKQYEGKFVTITCSTEAIVPLWAFLLVAISLQPYARIVGFGTLEELERRLFEEALATVDWSSYKGAKVVIKGCSRYEVPISVYVYVATKLRPFVTSLMYGEPCSTVPLYKSFTR
ncbi:MAG: DUF2480 family protein [Cyclobacteriaceae bacterium]